MQLVSVFDRIVMRTVRRNEGKMGNTRCLCEDRPACGCDADVYQPFGEEAPEYEMEDEEGENACSICHESLTDSENEDELVMGSHADCLEFYAG